MIFPHELNAHISQNQSHNLGDISVDVENSISSKEDWKKHQGAMSKAWERYKKSNLLPMLEWSGEYVSEDQEKHKDIRYPFSGPDILHALHMFPDAENFILCGLEPVGQGLFCLDLTLGK